MSSNRIAFLADAPRRGGTSLAGCATRRTGPATTRISAARSSNRVHSRSSRRSSGPRARCGSSARATPSTTSPTRRGDLVSLDGIPTDIRIDPAAQTVTIEGRVRYGELSRALDAAGFALPNLASLPHISVAGACATGTHGSGDGNGSLATSVTALELVRADGEIERLAATDADGRFAGAVVSLGALGVVIRMTLAVEPRFEIAQVVYEDVASRDVPRAVRRDQLERLQRQRVHRLVGAVVPPAVAEVAASRTTRDASRRASPERFGGRLAERDLHPIPGYPADACTVQRGIAGPWHERLPHFRLDHVPSAGDELQTEYLLDRRDLRRGARGAAGPPDADRAARVRERGPDDRRRRALAQSEPGSDFGGDPFHVAAGLAGVRELLPAIESAPRAVRAASALGQALHDGTRRSSRRATRVARSSSRWRARSTRTACSATRSSIATS